MGLNDAIAMLIREYKAATKNEYVKKPLAYALYRVWKQANKEGKDG